MTVVLCRRPAKSPLATLECDVEQDKRLVLASCAIASVGWS